eukprot:TRINITY_DN8311_c0_g2_i1.p1 TRINITY_DN8311_c0_g2~~TRINITY_DN8311_c0_g2_i1.p1  ORF type:complete len:155 (-),score=28.36 TRINITY_DN8311_c0_g2_i1:14-478(-)
MVLLVFCFFFFQAEDGIRDAQESRGLGDVYKRQLLGRNCGRAIAGPAQLVNRVRGDGWGAGLKTESIRQLPGPARLPCPSKKALVIHLRSCAMMVTTGALLLVDSVYCPAAFLSLAGQVLFPVSVGDKADARPTRSMMFSCILDNLLLASACRC